jgi:hypothetical protein
MAAGFDELVDFLLSEIALCGVQGMPDPLHHFFFSVYSIEHFLHVCALIPVRCNCLLQLPVSRWLFAAPGSHCWRALPLGRQLCISAFDSRLLHSSHRPAYLLTFCFTGAGSADFRRFVQAYFEQPLEDDASESEINSKPVLPPGGLGRSFHEKVWHWVSSHADIQIMHGEETRHYSLPEFEAAELQDADTSAGAPPTVPTQQSTDAGSYKTTHLSKSLLAMRESLRERLQKERLQTRSMTQDGASLPTPTDQKAKRDALEQHHSSSNKTLVRSTPRKTPSDTRTNEAVFDEPTTSAAGPRLYASQNRIWQALTGHSIDLKKVPSMEFVLLSIIASRGMNGITQPDLTAMSGQDKRSVPHRTDELSRKGYIQKMPVQAGKMRTSLCVHKKFVTKDHFLSSGRVEDVFQYKKFVLSGFIRLLHDKLKDSGVVLSRDIRKKLVGHLVLLLFSTIF